MIRVAVLCSTLNQLGGPAAHIRNLYQEMEGKGVKLTLVFCSAVEDDLCRIMRAGGVPDSDMIFIPRWKKRLLLPFVLELGSIFRRENFDIIHAFETQTQVLGGWAAAWSGVKKFVCHCEAQFLPSTISPLKRALFRSLNFFLKDYFTRTVVISSGLKEELLRYHLRPAGKVQLIHLGSRVPEGVVKAFSYPGLASGSPLIGSVSRLSVEKGLDRFIRAIPYILKAVPAARFIVCGDGDEKERLHSLAKELDVADKIDFRPWARDVSAVLQELDIFVMPSHREGLPNTLLEAMVMGRPTVVSDIDGPRDIIDNGVDGILADTADPQAFADAVVSVCHNPSLAAAMGAAAERKVRGHFNIEREACEILEMYEQLVAVRKIMVMELWGIGDVVMMSAVLKPLRAAFPQAEIVVLCQEHGREVLKENKEINGFVTFKFPWTEFDGKYCFWNWDWDGISEMITALWEKKFDLVFDARGDIRNDILSRFIKAERVVSAPYRRRTHRVDAWGSLLERIGVKARDLRLNLALSLEEQGVAKAFIAEHFPVRPRRLVAIHPGAARPVRRWPLERFGEVAGRLSGVEGVGTILLADAQGYGRGLAAELRLPVFFGDLRGLSALIAELDLLICNDTSVMHIASAFNVPTVAVFGPGDPALIGPRGPSDIVIADCKRRPCFDRCRKLKADCMERITVQDVWNKVIARLVATNKY